MTDLKIIEEAFPLQGDFAQDAKYTWPSRWEAVKNDLAHVPEVGALAGWISMKERRPADFDRVLCVNGAGYMTTANRFHMAGGSGEDWNGSDYTAEEAVECVIGGITHWMPLPSHPSPRGTTK